MRVEFDFQGTPLYLLVDDPRPVGSRSVAFVGDGKLHPQMPVQFVHVISPPAGGEIRGYVWVSESLRLRSPCYSGEWLDMDAAVSKALGVPVSPYRMVGSMAEAA
jgi:hypothetical protein